MPAMALAMVAAVTVVHDSALLFPIALGPPATHYVLDHVDARHLERSSSVEGSLVKFGEFESGFESYFGKYVHKFSYKSS